MFRRSRTVTACLISFTLLLFACKKNNDPGPTPPPPPPTVPEDSTAPLKNYADFPIGVAISYTPMLNDAKYSATVKRDFDAVTFDYNMKHGSIVQGNGTLNFTTADQLVNAVGSMDIFGHTLGWHQNQNATYLKNLISSSFTLSAEMLPNPGFESGLTNWSIFNTGDPAGTASITAASDAHGGTGSMQVVNPVAYAGNPWRVQVASSLVATTIGKQYVFSYWVKATAANGSIRISTADQNNANAQYQDGQTIGTSWQNISWTITATTTQTRFLFDMGQVANTYFVDDASVKEVISSTGGPGTVALLDQALNTYVTGMVDHFKAKVRAWDVINELFAEDGNIRNNTNTGAANDVFVWSHYMGRDYALKAFNYAKAADNTALLYINDYNLESSSRKLDSLIAFVAELKSKGAKVDGIGSQMHISSNSSFAGIDQMMQKLAATGLKIRISELDVLSGNGGAAGVPPGPVALASQAAMYKYVVNSYLKYVPVAQRAGITVWGLTDNTSWLYKNGLEYPLLYDVNYGWKPAYVSFLKALKGK
ncbi:MAG: endo-1,4-beta-xylanase [Chitinophagaceae bacterium]